MNERIKYVDRMIYHFNRKAIADCFFKLISNQTDISEEFTIEQEIDFKKDVIKKLVKSIIDNVEDEEVKLFLVYSKFLIEQKAENIVDFLQDIFKEKKLFNSMLESKDFNEIFDILLAKFNSLNASSSIEDKENTKLILNKIVLILNKINETIICDFKSNAAESKVEKSTSDVCLNNSINNNEPKPKENKYFGESESDENLKKEAEDLNNAESDLTEVYLSFIDIYLTNLPVILEFYNQIENRPKRKIASTYRNEEVEIFGTLNIQIIELIKSFFEILLLNSQYKAFGYKAALTNQNLFLMEEKFANKLKALFEVMFRQSFFKVCLNDFIKYEMNNYLQILVKNMVNAILDFSGSETNSIHDEIGASFNISRLLVDHLFSEIGLLDYIRFNTLDKIIEFDNTKSAVNSGFTPCLLEIAEKIEAAKSENIIIKEYTDKSIFYNLFKITTSYLK